MDKSSSIKGAIVIAIALSLSLWLGASIVTDRAQTILYIAGFGFFLICVLLGRKIWLLFIFLNALAFPLAAGIGTDQLGQMTFVGFTMVIILMRRQPLNFKFTELEFWTLLLAGTIIQVYLRNPVGLNIFGAGSVGAKPYFLVAMAFLASIFLANIVVLPQEIKWSMRLTIIAWFSSFFFNRARGLAFGGGGSAGFEQGAFDSGQAAGRNATFGSLSQYMAKTLAAFRSPLKDLIHPLWGFLILLTVAVAAASGYRNVLASVGLFYLIALAYRGGLVSMVLAGFLGVSGIAALALTNLAFPLPPNVQRALSPFPGTWEERYVKDADDSTEWRVDMWKEALFTDYWIVNKIFGDGLGLSQREYQLLLSSVNGGQEMSSMGSGMTTQQEAMMITGGYHSGPVQCVRITGYVGLLVLLVTMIRVAVHAHRQIMRCRGTEWYSLALFFGIPIIALPFIYVFVFGDFGRDVSATFIAIGMIRLLEKNLPLPPYVIRHRHTLSMSPSNTRNDSQPNR